MYGGLFERARRVGGGGGGGGEGEDGAGLYSTAALRAEEAPLHLACHPITAPMQSSLLQP